MEIKILNGDVSVHKILGGGGNYPQGFYRGGGVSNPKYPTIFWPLLLFLSKLQKRSGQTLYCNSLKIKLLIEKGAPQKAYKFTSLQQNRTKKTE